nr:uncharacterized protein LOC113815037 [Penaeus vannamei]
MYRSEDLPVVMKSPNLPLHELILKVGCVIMVIRNINPPEICNVTRWIIANLKKNIIVRNILEGVCDGEKVIIPRVTLISTDTPVHLKRNQFPVKMSFAVTINKSQGQTFDGSGLLRGGARNNPITENVFKLTEEEAIEMILLDYDTEDSLEKLKDNILETQ